MHVRLMTILTMTLLLAAGAIVSVRAQQAPPETPEVEEEAEASGFEAFSLVYERNIFNPQRRAPRPAGERQPEPEPQATPVPVEQINLVGALVEDEEPVAFVEGEGAPSDGVVREGDILGGWRIERIDTTGILLAMEGQSEVQWPVGRRIERRGDGEWSVAGEARPPDTARDSEPISGGSREDILRQMMERRQREMNR